MSATNTIIVPLPKPWKIAGKEVTEVELRPPLLDDILEAEEDAHPATRPNAFNVAMACRTIVRAGSFTGPFVLSHFKGMAPSTWYAIRKGVDDAEALGEAEQPSQAQQS